VVSPVVAEEEVVVAAGKAENLFLLLELDLCKIETTIFEKAWGQKNRKGVWERIGRAREMHK
jgi:hypothetical protein